MSPDAARLGLIAGGGALPLLIAEHCRAAARPVFVVRLKGMAEPALNAFEGADAGIAELGRVLGLLRAHECRTVCLAGVVKRPDFGALRPDLKGLTALPGVVAAARKGDDALLRHMIGLFEAEGFTVEGPDEVDAGLMLGAGPLGRVAPDEAHQDDIDLALLVARRIGELDVGQGAVAAGGVVLAVEAQEGTEAMLRRCAELPAALRGTDAARLGVLAKAPKPMQERRADLPVIGPATIEQAAAAGLAGVVGEAGGVLLLDRKKVAETADRLGLFVHGVPAG